MKTHIFLVFVVLGVLLAGCQAQTQQTDTPDAQEPECPGEAPSEDHFCLDGEWVPLPQSPGELS